jgi:hypothetical protein
MKTETATKARKTTASDIAARDAAKAAEAAKVETKAEAKAEGTVILSDAQRDSESAMVKAAKGVDGGVRKCAIAIHAVYAAGVHVAYGLSLPEYVSRTLSAAGVARSTVYYLRDIGCGYAALGTERANLFPMEGLRAIASSAKGDRARIEAMATDAQSGEETAAPTLANCRKAAKGTSTGRTEAQMVEALAKAAMKYAEADYLVAVAMLDKAAKRIRAEQKAAEAAAEDAED